jgi:hypothetical protein
MLYLEETPCTATTPLRTLDRVKRKDHAIIILHGAFVFVLLFCHLHIYILYIGQVTLSM